jgi:hypothetical protein
MVKPLNRTIRNEVCFVYKNTASEMAGLKPNDEMTIIEVKPNGNYIIIVDGQKREITKVQARLVMVFE